jgi:hypothetical protein
VTLRPKFLVIKKFREFQHYHTRGAPWIKLYGRLLEDAAFLSLSEAAQAQLMKLWLLASQIGHPLPNRPKLLAGKIGATGRFHLQAILEAGFLIECEESASIGASADASKTASTDASADASPTHARVPERREVRGESTENYTPSSARVNLPDRFENDFDRRALSDLLARAASPTAAEALIATMLDGGEGRPVPTASDMARAIHDYNANGAAWNAAHFRKYVRRAIAAAEEPVSKGSGRVDAGGEDEWSRGIARGVELEKAKDAAEAARRVANG